MTDTNRKLAGLFMQMADVLEILGRDRFRVNAFRRAGRVLGELATDVGTIGPDLDALCAIEGIGKGTAQRIVEFLQSGTMADHPDLMAEVPAGLMPLLGISGLGPKTIALLWKQGGIESLEDLKAKLAGDELASLPGLGAKKLANIRKSLAFAASAGGRVHIGVAMPLARWFVRELGRLGSVQQIAFAGSLRRGRETIGDIDLIVAADPDEADAITRAFVALEPVTEVLVSGQTKTSVRTSEKVQVDLRIVPPTSFGAALMYFTGSKEHNVAMRGRAVRMGLRLNEYALQRDGQNVAGATEPEVFRALGLAWIPPELREDRDELALAEADRLPQLIELADIRCELHAHTDASDGHWSIHELASTAAERGFHTVAVTDHSKGQVQANGLSVERLERHIEAVRAVAARLKGQIRVLAGSEVDIHADGTLDYPNSLLKELDIVVASAHSGLTQDPARATRRLLKAIRHPCVSILGHPTGRLLLRREGLSPDMRQLVAAAAERGIALEINANMWRLDLRDTHARAAIEAGAKLSINTDAHGLADLDQLAYGILTARRAGASRADVVNCLEAEPLAGWLRSTRP